jgi:hypothetical protein
MLSCSFERDLYLVQPQDSFIIPSSLSYPESYSTPLFASDTKFKDIHRSLGLSPAVASILDDVSFLTTTILSIPTSKNSPADCSPNKGSKFAQSTALWIYKNYHLLPINTSENSSTIDIIFPPWYTLQPLHPEFLSRWHILQSYGLNCTKISGEWT